MKIWVWTVAALAIAGACGDDSQGMAPDSAVDRPMIDAAIDGAIDAAVDARAVDASATDAMPGGCGMRDGGTPTGAHLLYLVYDGVMLMSGNCDDSRTNCTSLATANTTVTPFEATRANRQQFLDDITAAIRQQLAPYDIEVVTTRPASGDYRMIVFAQCVSSLSCQSGIIGVALNGCNATAARNSIALAFDQGTTSTFTASEYGGLAIFDLGITAALGPTLGIAGDCMNQGGTGLPCTFGTNVLVQGVSCTGAANQNEDLLMEEAFGCL